MSATYRANGTPSAYLIDAEGNIASELALGAESVLTLANETAESPKPKARTEQAPAGGATAALTNREEK